MKIFFATFLSQKFPATSAAISIIGIMSLSACSSMDTWIKQADSPLPIEVQHSGGGQIMSFRAHETSDRLYVSGSAKKHQLSNFAHVDIQLIGESGNIIAANQDDVDPTRPRPGGGKSFKDSYVASFPLSEARRATKIRVTYHNSKHQ